MIRSLPLYIYIVSALFFANCTHESRLQSADLIFIEEDPTSAMDSAIQSATDSFNTSFTHVGIIEAAAEGLYVIDATPRLGVARRPLEELLQESPKRPDGRAAVRYMRPIDHSVNPERVILKAKTYIGREYDTLYDGTDQKIYCSELVQLCYRDKNSKPIFESIPMRFSDSTGKILPYWQQLYDTYSLPVPEGEAGTNPNCIAASPMLIPVQYDDNGDSACNI